MKPILLDSPSNPRTRLTVALAAALLLHLAIILSIRFTTPSLPPEPVFSLNIALVEKSANPMERVVSKLSSLAPAAADPAAATSTAETQSPNPAPATSARELIASRSVPSAEISKTASPHSDTKTSPKSANTDPPSAAPTSVSKPAPSRQSLPKANALDLMNRGIQMARLGSLAEPEASAARVKHLNQDSMTTMEKFYMQAWERKVEQVGTLNFPEEARRLGVTNGPVVDVAILADGSIHSITLVRSSGYPELDAAARRIVELAAPYASFPKELRRQYDLLHIVRKWKFEHGRLLQ